ncbi:type II toxin-antitoxin system PemK/MazF family toxin [Candidatus Berkelbacteria bacterium]|nr:type II toxin-antitoxin system PemK/MazF family toxin [Candidatus Berkelbacteria bacterium]
MEGKQYQWGIFRAYLDPAVGSEQAGTRPVLVISNEAINHELMTVTVLPITSRKTGRRIYPSEALLPKGYAGLTHDSLVMAHQIRTISKQRLTRYYDTIGDDDIRAQIIDIISLYLDLPSTGNS